MMTRTKIRNGLAICLALAVLTLGQSPHATDKSWTGATSTTFSTSGNWSPSGAPVSTDNAVFNTTFSNQPNLTASRTIGGLWMATGVGQNVTISLSAGTALSLTANTINGTAGLGILV